MNLQNIPRTLTDVKECFISKLDAFLFFDYKNIEIRILAFYLSQGIGDDSMAKQFRENPDYDPHQETADLMGIDRQAGKTLNFSIQYGGGTPTIMRQLGCTYKEAKKLLDDFHSVRPGIQILCDDLAKVAYDRGDFGYVQNFYGRRGHVEVKFSVYKAKPESHKALNWLIQSTAADMMKQAMIEVDDYLTLLPWDDLDSHMVNTVHDEIMLDCRREEIPRLVVDIPKLMIDKSIHEIVPIEVDTAISWTTWAGKENYFESKIEA